MELATIETPTHSFPVATKTNERFKITSRSTWTQQRKALGITAKTDVAVVKKEQTAFMELKKQARQQAKALGAALVSGEGYDVEVQTWTNKKGAKQFQVRGSEMAADETTKAVETKVNTIREKMLKSGLTAEQVEVLLGE